MKFMKYTGVAILIALSFLLAMHWSFWTILFLLGTGYGLYILRATHPRLAKWIGVAVVTVLIGGWTWSFIKGNYRLTASSFPQLHGQIVKLMNPGLARVKTKLILELRKKEDTLEAEIPALMQATNHAEVIRRTQELIDLRKNIEKLLAQADPPKPAPIHSVSPDSDIITIGSGVYNFRLNPGETNDKWIIVEKDHSYSFSSSTTKDPVTQTFFIVYKDGKMIRIDRADIPIPPGPGPFKLMGGEAGAYVKLLIVKKT